MGKTFTVDLVLQEQRSQAIPVETQKLAPVTEQEEMKSSSIEDHDSKGSKNDAKEKKKKEKEKKKKKKIYVESDSSSSSDSSDSSDSETDYCSQLCSMEPWRYPLYSPSASYRQVDVVTGSHQYTISGFTLARSMGCGTRMCSDFFDICGQLFRLEVYPAGFMADTRKYVSVFLTTPGVMNPNQVMYELAILDQSGKDRHIIEKRGVCNVTKGKEQCCMSGPMMACSRGIVAAVPKLAKTKFLEQHSKRYLPCDILVLRASVQVLRGWSSSPMIHSHLACQGQQGSMMMPGSVFNKQPQGLTGYSIQPLARQPSYQQNQPLGPSNAGVMPGQQFSPSMYSQVRPHSYQPESVNYRPGTIASPAPMNGASSFGAANMYNRPGSGGPGYVQSAPHQQYMTPQQQQQQQQQQRPVYQSLQGSPPPPAYSGPAYPGPYFASPAFS